MGAQLLSPSSPLTASSVRKDNVSNFCGLACIVECQKSVNQICVSLELKPTESNPPCVRVRGACKKSDANPHLTVTTRVDIQGIPTNYIPLVKMLQFS